MEGGKDNRAKQKRNKSQTHYSFKKGQQRPTPMRTSSSSGQMEVVGVADVADSSDDRYNARKVWGSSGPHPQDTRFELDDSELAELEDNENAQMQAADFDIMSQMPTSLGGHFQFSSEKHWDTPEGEQYLDNTEASEYFTLNLKLLNVGLQTISFYKRMDYSSAMFTREQLVAMEQAAEKAEKTYQNVLKDSETNSKRTKVKSGSRKSASAKSQNSIKAAPSKEAAAQEQDELDELLSMATGQMEKVDLDIAAVEDAAPGTATAGTVEGDSTVEATTKDDIQQWLDNVLEE